MVLQWPTSSTAEKASESTRRKLLADHDQAQSRTASKIRCQLEDDGLQQSDALDLSLLGSSSSDDDSNIATCSVNARSSPNRRKGRRGSNAALQRLSECQEGLRLLSRRASQVTKSRACCVDDKRGSSTKATTTKTANRTKPVTDGVDNVPMPLTEAKSKANEENGSTSSPSPANDDDAAAGLLELGAFHLRSGDHLRAKDAFLSCYKERKRSLPRDSLDTLLAQERLADSFAALGRVREAHWHYFRCLRGLQKSSGGGRGGARNGDSSDVFSQRVARVDMAVGDLYFASGDHAKSLKYFGKSLQRREGLFGPCDGRVLESAGRVAGAHGALARTALDKGEKEMALFHARRSFWLVEKYGVVLMKNADETGSFSIGKELLKIASTRENSCGPQTSDRDKGDEEERVSSCLSPGDWTKAAYYVERQLNSCCQDSPERALMLAVRGALHCHNYELRNSAKRYAEALEISSTGDDNGPGADLSRIAEQLCVMLVEDNFAPKDDSSGYELVRDSEDIRVVLHYVGRGILCLLGAENDWLERLGIVDSHGDETRANFCLANALFRRGRHKESIICYRQCVGHDSFDPNSTNVLSRECGIHPSDRVDLLANLATSYQKTGRKRESKKLFERALVELEVRARERHECEYPESEETPKQRQVGISSTLVLSLLRRESNRQHSAWHFDRPFLLHLAGLVLCSERRLKEASALLDRIYDKDESRPFSFSATGLAFDLGRALLISKDDGEETKERGRALCNAAITRLHENESLATCHPTLAQVKCCLLDHKIIN